MKNTPKLHAILLAGMMGVCACNNGNTSNTNTTDSTSTISAKTDTAADKVKATAENAAGKMEAAVRKNEDSDFVVSAAVANNTELKILQAGIDKGTDKELKSHAKMMLSDHKKLGEKVKAWSSKKGYTLPADDNGKAADELSKLDKNAAGKDWDKAWTDHMVSAHKDAIGLFERGQGGVKDDELKNIIGGALPTLHSHLDMMEKLQDKLGK